MVPSVSPKSDDLCCVFEVASSNERGPHAGPTAGPSISVVINTDNRLALLKRVLLALRYQTYEVFEVCVVAGPTQDGTRHYLSGIKAGLKIAHCDARNLSKSRNLGIAMAAGEVVAFIDDDAVPEPEWLAQLARSYDDPRVGAAGGFVHDNSGIDYQARFVSVNRLGFPQQEMRPTPELNFPGSARIPHLLGTNCSFRRSALIAIGGFDEEYEYFLDETDVCLRINDAGLRVIQRQDAWVHHQYAASGIRDEQKSVRHWYPILKNRLYFGMRHAQGHHSPAEIVAGAMAERRAWELDVAQKANAGVFSSEDAMRFKIEAAAAEEDGLRASTQPAKLMPSEMLKKRPQPLRHFAPLSPPGGPRTLVYFNAGEGNPQPAAGLLRSQAMEAAREGHQVHLIVALEGMPSVDFDDGLWIHDLGSGGPVRDRGDERMRETIGRIASRRWIDAIYCPTTDRALLEGFTNRAFLN